MREVANTGENNWVTGVELNPVTRFLMVLGLMSWRGSWKAARTVGEAVLENVAKKYGLEIADVFQVANSIAARYPLRNLEDAKKTERCTGSE